MSRTGRALWFVAPGKVEVREECVHKAEGELFFESKLMGISHGTEMLFFEGTLPFGSETDLALNSLKGKLDYPIKYGYINAGVTESGQKGFAFYPHQDLFAVSQEEVIPLPDSLPFEDAVFFAHMETAVSILQDTSPVPGEILLIFGQGTIGLLLAELLARSGLYLTITVEPSAARRSLSEKLGCASLHPGENLPDAVRSLTGGRGADRAIDVSGAPTALQSSIDCLAFEGTVVEASWFGNRPVPLVLGAAFHRKRLKIRSSQVSRLAPELTGGWDKRRRMELVLSLLQRVRPSKYISHRFPLHKAQEAFELIRERRDEALQVVLFPG